MILAVLELYGLENYRPDLCDGMQGSLWNMAHRLIAIQTFKQACMGSAYPQYSLSMAHVQDDAFLELVWNHYVFFYKKGEWDKETGDPGAVAQQAELDLARERRKTVSFLSVDARMPADLTFP